MNTTVRRSAIAVLAALTFAACGGSDSDESADSVPGSDAVETVDDSSLTTDPPATTEAPVSTEAPVDTEPDVRDVPDLPCTEYVEETGYPLVPCDSGVLTETLQRDLVELYPDVFIDGLFGQQTLTFVQQFQTDNALEVTEVVSEDLAAQIAAASGEGATPTTEAGESEAEEDATDDAAETDETGDDETGEDETGDDG